jgi:predicted phosphodiesterase
MNKELTEKFKQYLQKKKKPYIDQICVDLGLQEYEVYGLIEILKNEGYLYDIIDGKIIKVKPIKESELYQIPNNLDHLKLLLISDTHLASKYDRLDILNYLYDEADKKGVNYVLHSGDLTEGLSGRPQQLYELKEASYTGQRDYVIDKYPKTDIPTYVIAGNHDQWWIKQCGADICRDISNNREDLIYLGSDCEDLKIGKLRIRLYHGTGGGAYAKSYKLQKYLDSVPMEERPHILQTGHIHQAFYMKQGNTHCFQTSCLQDQTPYERSKGLSNDKSCWWVDVYMDNKGNPVKINQELETFGKKLIRRK